ncbi:hypothetical protein M3Y97_00009900 [Aphelenchoides bicaudatus]|nr:hypothetical protein M3Y97_00009900 [Aphelenchoides bicaudatus]
MSVDAEIIKVREAIASVHRTFYGLTRGLQNITNEVDSNLDAFSSEVHGVQTDVQNIRGGVTHITDKFPNHTVYMAIFLTIDFLIWCLAAFLLFRIIQNCRYGPKNSTKIIEDYKHMVDPDYVQQYKREVEASTEPIEVIVNKKGLHSACPSV